MPQSAPSKKGAPKPQQVNVKQSGAVKFGDDLGEVYRNINIGGDAIKVGDVYGGSVVIGHEAQVIVQDAVDHAKAPCAGLGVWIWKADECEGGDPKRIADRAAAAGLSHVALKIADGPKPYGADRAGAVVAAIRERGLQAWGWHYLYGADPIGEARVAAQLTKDLNLNGYVANVEREFKQPGRAEAAGEFFRVLRDLAGGVPIGLSSFHYPSFHRDMPWPALLEGVDFVLPLVYWEQAHNPGAQLARSVLEYGRLAPPRPFFPVGSAYGVGEWKPAASDLAEFIQSARDLGLNGASFFSWDWLGRAENQELWAVLDKMRWETVTPSAELARPSTTEAEPTPPAEPQSDIPAPSFERRFIQIIRNDEVDQVEDRLGFEQYVEAFVQLVLDDRTRPPLTVGISGAWGSGKSFLLHRIYRELDRLPPEPGPGRRWYQPWAPPARRRLHVVRFNAWDYNASEAVWPGLVRGILDRLEAGAGFGNRTWGRVRRNLKRQADKVRGKLIPWTAIAIAILVVLGLLTWGNWPLLLASLGTIGLGGLIANFVAVANMPMAQWITNLFAEGRSYGGVLGYMDEIRADIEALKRGQPAGAKIVVIIDDLDRCDADKIVNTLEALKLLLNFDIFVVFLAVDSSVIARAVEKRYKELLAEAGRSGYFYLDKIIQIPFRIPEPDPERVNTYLFGLLSAADAPPARTLPPERAEKLCDWLMPVAIYGPTPIQKMTALLPDDGTGAEGLAEDIRGVLVENGFVEPSADVFAGDFRDAQLSLAWALLAHWWPVTTYLMHEAMRAGPAGAGSSEAPPASAIEWLAGKAAEEGEANIRTQRLRQVVDGPLDMFRAVVEAAPVASLPALEEMLKRWKTPYAVLLGFTAAELEAFQNLAGFLYKNPRHIKRMVNTYSLIRMLAARSPHGELVLNAPETMLKWLIISSQWPLTAQGMLQTFDDERQAMRPGETLADDDDALTRLYQKAVARINASQELQKERARLDGDPDLLDRLIGDSLRTLTSRQFDLLRAYAINFNPAENSLPQAVALPPPAPAGAQAQAAPKPP